MRSDPEIAVTCDECKIYSQVVGLTAISCGGYDERNVEGELKRCGWETVDGRDICPDCIEERKRK